MPINVGKNVSSVFHLRQPVNMHRNKWNFQNKGSPQKSKFGPHKWLPKKWKAHPVNQGIVFKTIFRVSYSELCLLMKFNFEIHS